MSRMTLLALQVLVAIVCIAMWQLLSTVPIFGKILLPPFFFSNPGRCVRARSSNGSGAA